jgi:hypothetical protein
MTLACNPSLASPHPAPPFSCFVPHSLVLSAASFVHACSANLHSLGSSLPSVLSACLSRLALAASSSRRQDLVSLLPSSPRRARVRLQQSQARRRATPLWLSPVHRRQSNCPQTLAIVIVDLVFLLWPPHVADKINATASSPSSPSPTFSSCHLPASSRLLRPLSRASSVTTAGHNPRRRPRLQPVPPS